MARLIQVKVKVDNGTELTALIDCGSQIDILNSQSHLSTQIPMDKTVSTVMRDAGQRDTSLHGRCYSVNIYLGELQTVTDLWVGGNIPYDVVLGRSWTRRNGISIDEQSTGTWLASRNLQGDVLWELCAVPAQ